MSQEFRGHVGQVAAGDIQNLDIKIQVPGRPEDKVLVPAQRAELHELRAKCEELGADPRDVWRAVHAQLAVKSIDQIQSNQLGEARRVITCLLERLMDDADRRRLVGKILRTAAEKDARVELSNFCDVTFGRTQLTNLQRPDLQRVLEFIQSFQIQPLQTEQSLPPSAPELSARLPLRDFLVTYKSNAFWLFMLGVIVDRFWFR
ncbi:hypothetical protein [Pseudomonas rubra]|uniref:Uncharacterized protein n=1 Tax=Pseudomonas rubra TaxID=2942627 RepID=A0ABT5P981_9PSED|nr:hypothetical protein [Pseudomonas rubra]MDD1014554.1 hypothetical protein [Pseudomonas rubra]MDD1041522.1 hypothetical protein [Pseudomonas rubra]MDD1157958.1 hypothetical protein [Pseudomonas rubra]